MNLSSSVVCWSVVARWHYFVSAPLPLLYCHASYGHLFISRSQNLYFQAKQCSLQQNNDSIYTIIYIFTTQNKVYANLLLLFKNHEKQFTLYTIKYWCTIQNHPRLFKIELVINRIDMSVNNFKYQWKECLKSNIQISSISSLNLEYWTFY